MIVGKSEVKSHIYPQMAAARLRTTTAWPCRQLGLAGAGLGLSGFPADISADISISFIHDCAESVTVYSVCVVKFGAV